MKKAFTFVLVLFVFIGAAQSNSCATKLGVFGGGSPARKHMLLDIQAKVVRVIFDDSDVQNALQNPSSYNSLVKHFDGLRSNGIETIFCLRFPKGADGTAAYGQDRIPNGTDHSNSLQLIRDFLAKFDTVMDYYQIQNEIMGGPGAYIDTMDVCGFTQKSVFSGANAFEWLDTLAFTAKEAVQDSGLNVKIMSPSVTGVLDAYKTIGPIPFYVDDNKQVVCGGNHIPYAIEKIILLSKKYCDAIDIHLNVSGVQAVKDYIHYVDSVRKANGADHIPFSTTEWNQAKERQTEINDGNSYFNTFLTDAIANKVSYSDWNNYVDSLNYDTSFIEASFKILQENGFVHACYNGVSDGPDNLIFLPVALLPLETVTQPDDTLPNTFFYSRFKSLATQLPASFSLDFSVNPSSAVVGEQVSFINNTDTAATGGYQFDWSFGDGNSSTEFDPSHAYNSEGIKNIKLMVTNVVGCKDSLEKSITVSPITNIKEQNAPLFLELYPNPFNTVATLSWSNSIRGGLVVVYNSEGKKVKSITVQSNILQLDASHFSPGIYIACFTNGQHSSQLKIVVK